VFAGPHAVFAGLHVEGAGIHVEGASFGEAKVLVFGF
jgi:hypothetical protein